MKVSVAAIVLLAACAVTLAVEHAPTPAQKTTAQKTTALNPVTDAKKAVAPEQNRDKRHLLGLGALGLGAAVLGAGLIGAKAGIVGGALAGGLAGSIASRGRSYDYDYPAHYTTYNNYNSYPSYISYSSYPAYSSGCTFCDTYRPYPYAGGYGYYKK